MAICSRLAKRTWKIYEVVHAEILKSEQSFSLTDLVGSILGSSSFLNATGRRLAEKPPRTLKFQLIYNVARVKFEFDAFHCVTFLKTSRRSRESRA